MKTVDAVDNEIRFTDFWEGMKRYVFIPDLYVTNDAGYRVSREEAIAFVRDNLDRYRREAREQCGAGCDDKIIILDRPGA